MRLANVNDEIFENLMDENEKIIYNLFELIREDSKSLIVTDDRSYIFAGNSRRAPNWLFLKSQPEGSTFDELVKLISGMADLNALFKINGQEEYIRPLLDKVSEKCRRQYKPEFSMEVYSCVVPIPLELTDGKMILPREDHRPILKDLIALMVKDSEGFEFNSDDSDRFTTAMLASKSLSLWENNEGKIVSMTKVAHRNSKYARINTIFTDHSSRGHDYTKMLLSCVTKSLLADGITPIIYIDKTNEKKAEAYRKVGYEKVGEVTQFSFEQTL